MKKIYVLIFIFMMSITLSGCRTRTYDTLYEDYETYLTEQKDVYQNYIDYVETLSSEVLKSVVLVKADFLSYSLENFGSGAVIDEDDTYYYVLTNNHVVTFMGSYATRYEIKNYLDETLSATVMFSDENYDLALLKVEKPADLTVFEINYDTLSAADLMVVAGYPSGQNHAITMGYFMEYNRVTVTDDSSAVNKVTFDIIISSVPVKSGSSGSALINESSELVGLIYAGRFPSSSDVSSNAYAIPAVKILEFLELHGYGGLSSWKNL